MKAFSTVIVVGLLLVLGYVWERVDLVRVGYKIERLKEQKVALQRERDELRLRVSALTSPERIARAATERLAMAPPARGQVVVVKLERETSTGGRPARQEIRLAKNDLPALPTGKVQ